MYIGVLKYRMLMIQLHETDPTSPGSVGEEIASPPCESEHAMPIYFLKKEHVPLCGWSPSLSHSHRGASTHLYRVATFQ
jgi:hypothetical protein